MAIGLLWPNSLLICSTISSLSVSKSTAPYLSCSLKTAEVSFERTSFKAAKTLLLF